MHSQTLAVSLTLLLSSGLYGCSSADDLVLDVGSLDAGWLDASTDVNVDPSDGGGRDVGSDGGGADVGAVDGGADGGGADAGLDGAVPDPLSCPMGEIDDCCPLAIRYGGTDPDCASHSCDSYQRLDDPIILDPIVEASTSRQELGTAALAFTGRDLAIAWTDIKREIESEGRFDLNYYFERRSLRGELLGPIREGTVTGSGSQLTRGPARLEYDADDGIFPFALTNNNRATQIALLDEAGELLGAGSLSSICNGAMATMSLFDTEEGFFSVHSLDQCTGASILRLSAYDADLELLGGFGWDEHEGGPTIGYFHPASRRASWLSAEGPGRNVFFRSMEAPAELRFDGHDEVPASEFGPDNGRPLAWAMDGTNFAAVVSHRAFDRGRFRYSIRVAIIDGITGDVVPGGGLLPVAEDRRALHAQMKWVGSGYVVALTTIFDDGDSSNAPDEDSDPRTTILSLDSNGQTRESFELAEANAMYPDIAWAGGVIAVSWVETQDDGRRFHMLDFLNCR